MSEHKSASKEQIPRGVTKITELLAEKHTIFDRQKFETGKLLQKTGWEERKSVEHSRETFLNGSWEKFSTTSAGDQDES
jgi:hypothetical protein